MLLVQIFQKSATNSVLWHMGDEIPYIPIKKKVVIVLWKIEQYFSIHLKIQVHFQLRWMSNVDGSEIISEPLNGRVLDANTNEVISEFELKTDVLLDEVRANGRIPLIIGRQLTDKSREALV